MVWQPFAQTLVKTALGVPSMLGSTMPVNDRGAELDAQTHGLLRLLEASGLPGPDELGAERARAEMSRQTWLVSAPIRALHRVEDRRAGGIPVRIYVPRSGNGRLPATVYYHGGGFVLGGLDSHDALCRYLAEEAGTVVVSVDYRLAPEHPFPAGVEDAVQAFRWVRSNANELGIDPERIAVAGDSAGGNLSAVVAQQLRDAGEPMPCFQLLIYPACDLTRSFESHRTFREGFFLTDTLMDWFVANYLTDKSEERDPRGSPLSARDLRGLPAAHVVTAGFDPLRDEGEAYARALAAAGVPTTQRCYESLIHGFASMSGVIDAADHAVADMADVLRTRLWP